MLTKEQVEHIAKLARLSLSEEEKTKFQEELSAILSFVEKLNEVDVGDIKPMTGGTDLVNRIREDKPGRRDETQRRKILANVPKEKDGCIEVKAVFE